MVWTGYMDDSHLVQGEHNEYDGDDIDDYYDPHPEPMTFQEWTDWCVVEHFVQDPLAWTDGDDDAGTPVTCSTCG